MRTKSKLSRKQELFVAEYLVDLNGTRAAIKAGYSEKTATEQASRLLTRVKVVQAIREELEKRFQKLEISADKVLQGIAKMAYFDPRKFFHEDGSLKKVTELDPDTAQALAGIEVNEIWSGRGERREQVGTVTRVKFPDRGLNLERLGRYLKLFTDKVELSGSVAVEVADRLREARKRAAELEAPANSR
jgi:phage terminase small subunit